ncbi:response regulator transcription factor [Paraburkholderia ginsengisoli]|uniref:Response regulator transcription factor n=1 Tax=Paraburkholderia ginsengisoli TaxID=311231 RepID=A0A7T4N336_9BURK|nr:response regulator transcription factor [Paraburkholderia ginsengisoli]QQC64314.1 response regulator transcription factor [Paraburkholderia ginsengisoli]
MRILLVEDEKKLAHAIQEHLESAGYEVRVAGTGEDGFFLMSTTPFDLVVLDLMLPGRDGIEILSTLRARNATTPVIIITARDAVEDRVHGLDTGADDYLVKPFALPELLARIRALLRRGISETKLKLEYAGLEMNLVTREVTRDGCSIDLTFKEFEILEYLLRHCGSTVTRAMIVSDIWQEVARAAPLDNVIDVHMARLRKKVDAGFEQPLVHTIRGVGFILRSVR